MADDPNETADIIWQSAQRESLPPGETREIYLAKVAQLVQSGTALFQVGKTVFTITPLDQGIAELHTFTAEDGRALVQRYVQAAQLAKQSGVKKIISWADSPAFVKIAKSTGLPIKIGQEPHMDPMSGQMRPMYKFELDL